MDLVNSGLDLQKQMRSKVYTSMWSQLFISKQLVLVEISNCYTQDANAMAMDLQGFSTVSFNRIPTPPTKDESQEKPQENGRNLDELWKNVKVQNVKLERILEIFWFDLKIVIRILKNSYN